MNKAIFLDRDGTITDESCYPDFFAKNCKLVEENIWEVLKEFRKDWYLLVIITNQAWIDKWYYTEKDFWEFMKKTEELLKIKFDKIYFCPYHPDYSWKYPCRKPNNWMILQAKKELNIDLEKSFMIWDNKKDIIAWKNSKTKTILYNSQKLDINNFENKPDFVANNWEEIKKFILKNIKNDFSRITNK